MPGEDTHGLRAQLAVALKERDEARGTADVLRRELDQFERSLDAWKDAATNLRTALTDIVTLCMDVPATEDWRAKVGDKARKALYGEAAWQTK